MARLVVIELSLGLVATMCCLADQALGQAMEPITVENAVRIELVRTLVIPGFARGQTSQCSVAFSADGRLLVPACGVSRVPLFNVQTGSVERLLYEEPEQVVACAFSPDGRWLACGGFSRAITLWDLADGDVATIVNAHAGPVWDIAFSPDSARLVSCSIFADVRVWSIEARELVWSYLGQGAYLSVAFSPSGEVVACGGRWDGVRVLDAATGQVVAQPRGPYLPVGDVAFSPNGDLLAAGADDFVIYLWSSLASAYTPICTLRSQAGYVNGVAISPDGTLLASGSHDQTVTIWDVAGRRSLKTLTGHTAQVLRVAWSPDGTLVASTSWDGTVCLWGVRAE